MDDERQDNLPRVEIGILGGTGLYEIEGIEEIALEPPSKIIDHLKTKLSDFTGERPQGDDILMLALKMK